MSKRRRGYPSETNVGKGRRVVRGEKELEEKLGRRDLCPCGSGRRFQSVLYAARQARRRSEGGLLSEAEQGLPTRHEADRSLAPATLP